MLERSSGLESEPGKGPKDYSKGQSGTGIRSRGLSTVARRVGGGSVHTGY